MKFFLINIIEGSGVFVFIESCGLFERDIYILFNLEYKCINR